MNGDGSELAEIALVFELLTNAQDQILHARRCARPAASPSPWNSHPVNALKTFADSTPHPALDSRQRYAESPRDRSPRARTPGRADDVLAASLDAVFCSRMLLKK
jgi:hypothetical protein